MKQTKGKMKAMHIAPCGMNCRLCYGYIRKNNQCQGCRAADNNKPKSCINCKIVLCEKRKLNKWDTCALCDTPCQRLKELDKRYQSKYHMSMFKNLAAIKEQGMDLLLKQQEKEYICPTCGTILCVHKEECPACGNPQIWEG